MFERLIVAPAASVSTTFLFTTEERAEMIRLAVADLENVTVEPFSGLTVDFARKCGARVLVRGIRAVTDFYAEFDMALMNKKMRRGSSPCIL